MFLKATCQGQPVSNTAFSWMIYDLCTQVLQQIFFLGVFKCVYQHYIYVFMQHI